jgi:mono/diheme cytochrome c family protein
MKKRVLLFLLAFIISSLSLVSCGGLAGSQDGDASENQSERPEPPQEYAGKTNPFARDTEAVTEGEALYQSNCYSCHGEEARGDGPSAAALNPKPPDLVSGGSELSDDYLHWRIAEGGMMRPFNSVMPSWKGILSEDQIWKIITFLRTLQG